MQALSATLDRDDPLPREGDALPPLWHWLFFLPADKQSSLATDGHLHRGAFLPAIDLPRRMWAGSRLEFLAPLHIGDRATRVSRVVSVTPKQGKSGPLVFVVVRHEISGPSGLAMAEEHDIVYRGHGEPPPPGPDPSRGLWTREVIPSDVLLFRYSALTFNAHRIHYDRRYCVEREGYPGLVVHGPLIATLLLDLVRRNMPEATISKFEFRATAPLYDTDPFVVCGTPEGNRISLFAKSAQGHRAMTAVAEMSR